MLETEVKRCNKVMQLNLMVFLTGTLVVNYLPQWEGCCLYRCILRARASHKCSQGKTVNYYSINTFVRTNTHFAPRGYALSQSYYLSDSLSRPVCHNATTCGLLYRKKIKTLMIITDHCRLVRTYGEV